MPNNSPLRMQREWVAFLFVLCRLNRCHPQKVNKIKGFSKLKAVLYASLMDASFDVFTQSESRKSYVLI